jgi:excisionase family DNA binding protein
MISGAAERLALRIPEAADRVGVSRSTMYLLIQKGEVPVIKIGKSIRVPAAALAEWVERSTAFA